MRSLRYRVVEGESSETEAVTETQTKKDANAEKKKRSKKSKKSSNGGKLSRNEDNETHLDNTYDRNVIKTNSQSSDTINTSLSSLASETAQSKKVKKGKKVSKIAKNEELKSPELLKNNDQNLSTTKENHSTMVRKEGIPKNTDEENGDGSDANITSEKSENVHSKNHKKAKKHCSKTVNRVSVFSSDEQKDYEEISSQKKNDVNNTVNTRSVTSEKIKKAKKDKKSSKRVKYVILSPEDEFKSVGHSSVTAEESQSPLNKNNDTDCDIDKKYKKKRKNSKRVKNMLLSPEDVLEENKENSSIIKKKKLSPQNEHIDYTSPRNVSHFIDETDNKKKKSEWKKSKYFKSQLESADKVDLNQTHKTQFVDRPSFFNLVTSTNKKHTPRQEKEPSLENSNFVVFDLKKNNNEITSYENMEEDKITYEKVSSKQSQNENDTFDNITSAVYLDNESEVNMNEIINISDSIVDARRDTFDVSDNINTMPKAVSGNSGEWRVESLLQTSISNENLPALSNNTINKNERNVDKPLEGFSTPDKQVVRKKWIKFALDSDEANSLLEEIGSPSNKKSLPKTPIPKRSIQRTPRTLFIRETNTDESLSSDSQPRTPKSLFTTTKSNESLSDSQRSFKRSACRPAPDFAKIHQRTFNKMESLIEYSERKNKRAELLLSGKRTPAIKKSLLNQENINKSNMVVTPATSARRLLKKVTPKDKLNLKTNASSTKKSGHKPEKKIPKASKLPVRQLPPKKKVLAANEKVTKAPIFERAELISVGNKMKPQNTPKVRETNRKFLNGVRINRRFELLMQMRNK